MVCENPARPVLSGPPSRTVHMVRIYFRRTHSALPTERRAGRGAAPNVPAVQGWGGVRDRLRGLQEAVQDLGKVQAQQAGEPDGVGPRVQVRVVDRFYIRTCVMFVPPRLFVSCLLPHARCISTSRPFFCPASLCVGAFFYFFLFFSFSKCCVAGEGTALPRTIHYLCLFHQFWRLLFRIFDISFASETPEHTTAV